MYIQATSLKKTSVSSFDPPCAVGSICATVPQVNNQKLRLSVQVSDMKNPLSSFGKLDRIQFIAARVESQQVNKNARVPAYLLGLDVGKSLLENHKKPLFYSSAQLTVNHRDDELLGKSLMVVSNFPRKQIGPIKSDCLVTGAQILHDDFHVRMESTVALETSQPVAPGTCISIPGCSELGLDIGRKLSFDDFKSVEIRVGKVIGVAEHSDLSGVLEIDLGQSVTLQAATGWQIIPESIFGQQACVVLPSSSDVTANEGTLGHILSADDGIWVSPIKPCENGFRLA